MADTVQFKFIKILDIGYVSAIYMIIGLIWSSLLKKYRPPPDLEKEKKKSFIRLAIDLFIEIWILLLIVYFTRSYVEKMSSPFDNKYGFIHKNLKELNGAAALTQILYGLNYIYKTKIQAMYDKI